MDEADTYFQSWLGWEYKEFDPYVFSCLTLAQLVFSAIVWSGSTSLQKMSY